MLPDYQIFKNKFEKRLVERIRVVAKESHFLLSQVARQRRFEGNIGSLIRENGAKEDLKIHEFKEEMEWRHDEVDTLTLKEVISRLDNMAKQMAEQQVRMTYEEIGRSVKAIGNEVDVKGERFAPRHFFEMVRRRWMSFDEYGNPEFPTIVAGEKALEGFKRVMKEIDDNQALSREFHQILESKYLEWRDREANRTLVG